MAERAPTQGQANANPLGRRLVKEGVITEDQLRLALQEVKRTGALLGRTLRDLGFAKDDQLSKAYSAELQIPHLDLDKEKIDSQAVMAINKDFCKEKSVLGVKYKDDELVVCMADPYDVQAIDAVERMTHTPVSICTAPEERIVKALNKYFSKAEFSENALETLITNTQSGTREDEVDAAGTTSRGQAPIVVLVDQIIMKGVAERATDVHIEPEEKLVRVRYRIDGVLHQGTTLPKELKNEICSRIKIMATLDIAEKRRPQDGQITIQRGHQRIDIRVSIMPVVHGEAVVMRLLDKASTNVGLEMLGMSTNVLEAMKRLANSAHGIVLVTGPTGSGKTTTLYSLLKHINLLENSVLTLEDPVEYQIPLIRQTQVRPDIGFGFAEGLRAFLRQDPDVIMVGEVRDLETVQIAIRAALTGHLVLATLHTNSSLEAITRLCDMGVDPYLVGSALHGLQAQRLVRKLCTKCNYLDAPRNDERDFMGAAAKDPNLKVSRGKGCPDCFMGGYRGREGIYEVIELDEEFRALVRKRADLTVLVNYARERGDSFMHEDGVRKILKGLTSVDECRRVLA